MSLKKHPVAALIVGLSIVAGILLCALFIPNPTGFQRQVFQTILAIGAGVVTLGITGTLRVQINKFVSGTGAVAVIVLVYLVSPAMWQQEKQNSDISTIQRAIHATDATENTHDADSPAAASKNAQSSVTQHKQGDNSIYLKNIDGNVNISNTIRVDESKENADEE